MRTQATRLDVIEQQQQRRRERLAWWIYMPIASGYFGAVLTYPLWS